MATITLTRLSNGNIKVQHPLYANPRFIPGDGWDGKTNGTLITFSKSGYSTVEIETSGNTIVENGNTASGSAAAIMEVLATTTFFKPAGVTVDTAITDGSANAISSNAVFDALALKSNAANAAFTGTHQLTSNSDVVLQRSSDANSLIGLSVKNAGGAEVGAFKANMQTGEFKVGGTGSGFFTTLWSELGEVARINAAGNVGIGTGATINASAKFQVTSTTKGILFPVMTTTQKNAISSPAEGLVVYDSTLHKLCVRVAAAWETITSS